MAKFAEPVHVCIAVVVAQVRKLAFHLLLYAALYGLELAVVLQHLAADVQVQIRAVHNAAHEAERLGQQVLALLHDHDA